MGLRDIIIPQDKFFFKLFEDQAEILCQASDLLVDIFSNYTDLANKYQAMKSLEHKGDDLTHKAHDELNRTFITPIEPEEISKLLSTLDDVVDHIDAGANMLLIYDIKSPDEYMIKFASIIQKASLEIRIGVGGLRTLHDPDTIHKCCVEISKLEHTGDKLLSEALSNLFKVNDPVSIIKMKDIYEHFEMAIDKCEDVADVFDSILIRHT